MLGSEIKSLIDDLSSCILQTSDINAIECARAFGYFLLQTPSMKNSSHDFKFWFTRWKNSINPNKIDDLKTLQELLPESNHPIYTLLDGLKRSSMNPKAMIKEEASTVFQTVGPFAPVLSEEEIIPELLLLLKGQESTLFKLNGMSIETQTEISSADAILIKKIFQIILCLKTIKETKQDFSGEMGNVMRSHIDEEYSSFIKKFETLDENSTYISILSVLSGQIRNRIIATTIICETVKSNPMPSIINSVMYTQNYGLQAIQTLSSRMVDASIVVLLKFIRNWTVFGIIDDPHSEFFIKKNTEKVATEKWWSMKYYLIKDLLPTFLIDNNIVKRILSSGRAHNFLRKYNASWEMYTSNFGSSAPFAVNFVQPKAKRVNPDLAWIGPPFELSMVDYYATESMKSLMSMMMKVVWIPGHLKVVQDFILFARGDFASVLYKNFNESVDGDAPTLLLQAIHSITQSNDYTNPITKEVLTDRIDMQKKWSVQPTAPEALIVYLVNPPIDAFLGKSVLDQYDLIGHLIWKLKCCECQLGFDWRNARQLQMMEVVGFKSRVFCVLRHLMVYTIRTLLEYLSTDIILVNWKLMETKMNQTDNFDELFDIHKEYLSNLLKGSFQTTEFEDQKKAVDELCHTIGEFTDIEQEFEAIYLSILNQMKKNEKWMKRENPFFTKTIQEIQELNQRVREIYGQFNEQLAGFYLLSYDNTESIQMNQLEVRLRSCVANIQ